MAYSALSTASMVIMCVVWSTPCGSCNYRGALSWGPPTSLDTCWTILHAGDEGWGVKRNTDGNRSSLMRLEALTSAQQADVSRRRSVMEYWLPLFGSCISSHFIWHVLYVLHVYVYVLCVQHNYMYYLHTTHITCIISIVLCALVWLLYLQPLNLRQSVQTLISQSPYQPTCLYWNQPGSFSVLSEPCYSVTVFLAEDKFQQIVAQSPILSILQYFLQYLNQDQSVLQIFLVYYCKIY